MGEYIRNEPDLGPLKPTFTCSSEPESPRTAALIQSLFLIPHMEGGYFVQTDEDPTTIPSTYPPEALSAEALSAETTALAGPIREGFDAGTRRLSTTIFYLLTPCRPQGMFHRNRSRVIHTLHRGRGRYVLIHPDSRVETFVVGHAVERGERIQWVVEGDVWKASYLLPSKDCTGQGQGDDEPQGLLISETVVPGFEYCDHQFLSKQGLRELLPKHQARELDWLVREPQEEPEYATKIEPTISPIVKSTLEDDVTPDDHGIKPPSLENVGGVNESDAKTSQRNGRIETIPCFHEY